MHMLLIALVLSAAPRRVTDDQGCNKGIDENNELDGEIVCTFPGGKKKYEGLYRHGKREGVQKTWREDGKLASVERFKDGKRDGLCEDYDREGFLDEACEYKAEQKHGPCKLYGREGKLREERNYVAGEQRGAWTGYWPNGKVQEKGFLDPAGKRHGLIERFREDGSPDSATGWAHGEKDGLEREWHANGKVRRESSWQAGKQHGVMRDFHETGQLSSATCYQQGSSVTGLNPCLGKTGSEVVTRAFPDGKPYETTTVKDGKKNGVAQRFERDGALKLSETWADDKLDGPQKLFEKGKLKRQVLWKAGRRDGAETLYFEDGKVSEETVWKADQRQSHTTWWMNGKKKSADTREGELWKREGWYDNGQKRSEETTRDERYRDREGVARGWSERGTLVEESNWKRDKRHGAQKGWFEKTGRPAFEEEWADGVRLSRKEWDEGGAVQLDERYNADGSRK
jgi:antitoxin component YwqK of YwqJK toxin-antitoxin module